MELDEALKKIESLEKDLKASKLDAATVEEKSKALDAHKEKLSKLESEMEELRKAKADDEGNSIEYMKAEMLKSAEKRDAAIKQYEDLKLNTEMESKTRLISDALNRAAMQAGVNDEEKLNKLLRLVDKDALEFDDDGNPKNAADLVKAEIDSIPGFVDKKGGGLQMRGGGAGNGDGFVKPDGTIDRAALKDAAEKDVNNILSKFTT